MNNCKPVFRMWRRVAATLLILGITGGHWGILQSVAWTRMIIAYSRTAPIQTALEQTFDGKHPCAMCKAIQKAKQTAQQQELQQPSVNRDTLFCESYAAIGSDEPWSWLTADSLFTYPTRVDPPPVPPPNGLFRQA
jgi:hypothetical protein